MAVEIKSYNQILGEMARKVIADSPLNDLNVGSVLLTLLEAAAQVDFENNASALSILELLSIDATKNNDLDSRAADYGLSRTPARKATGAVTIQDTSITKRSTGLYQVKPAPIAGATQIFVNNALGWASTGNIYVGRGTNNFEGPIPYTSIANNGTFYTITLGAALKKDHLISDSVVDGQGTTNRAINAGRQISIPANNQSPAVDYVTLRDAVIPAGEDKVENVAITALLPGSQSNAGINTITQFSSPPFAGAAVYNTSPLTDGSDIESDSALRERIKSYANTLARGTQAAILAGILGVSSTEDNKQVASAVITEPPILGDPSIVYIDDGSGFQPSFAGQSVDKMITSATGKEEFLQLSNFPLPRPQAINVVDGPYILNDGMRLLVAVDGAEEAVEFTAAMFNNIKAARIAEIIVAINASATTFKATFTNNSNRILLFPVSFNAETIQVTALKATDDATLFANTVLKFPTNENSYIRLYQNNTLLKEKQKSATLLTSEYSTWKITIDGDLSLAVDGTPAQVQGFSAADFGNAPYDSLQLQDWVDAFNKKFAGITALATSSGKMQLTSNKIGSSSTLDALGGTYLDSMFGSEVKTSVGQNADFQLNRQTGNLRILRTIAVGDTISAGTENSKGAVVSVPSNTGRYDVSSDSNSRAANMIIVDDATVGLSRTAASVAADTILDITNSGNIMRLMSHTITTFAAVQPDDFVYITERVGNSTYFDHANTGLFKIINKGPHTEAGVDTYVEMHNLGGVNQSVTVIDINDVQFFASSSYPQLWKGSFASTPASSSIQELSDSINDNLVNTIGSVYKTNSLKITSTTESGGSIMIPVSTGKASSLAVTQGDQQLGNPSHIANRTISKDVVSFFKRTVPTSLNAEGTANKRVWLDRSQYSDLRGGLTTSVEPGVSGIDTYGEELTADFLTASNVSYDDIVNILGGANKSQYRSVQSKINPATVGTQHELPRTLMDYIAGDAINLMRPISISSEDSIVFIMDQDPVGKTIDIPMSRRGRVNSSFSATDLSFSADDIDNEPGVTFSRDEVWGKTTTKTEFKNYAVWMRARNWYTSGGATSGGGSMILRAKEFGPHGEKIRFNIEHPMFPNQSNAFTYMNSPDYTLATYTFGSGPVKPIGMVPGDSFTVTAQGSDIYRLTFTTGSINLATIVVGDVISISSNSGVSAANCGEFSVIAVNAVNKTIDIYNPNGTETLGTRAQIEKITAVADIADTFTTSHIVITQGNLSDALNGRWFKLYDSMGYLYIYYSTEGYTPSYGPQLDPLVNRIITIPIPYGAAPDAVGNITVGYLAMAGAKFTSSYNSGTDTLTIINTEPGNKFYAEDSPYGGRQTGFTFSGTTGSISSQKLDGKYFTAYDSGGKVAFWYDITGLTLEPTGHGAYRTVRISAVNAGDSAGTVATKTAAAMTADGMYTTSVLSAAITATHTTMGPYTNMSSGTLGAVGFTVSSIIQVGWSGTSEQIVNTQGFAIFPLLNNAVSDIVAKINLSDILDAVVVDGTNPIVKATREEAYTPAGIGNYSVSLAYGHNPNPGSTLNEYVSLYDSINWINIFSNTGPNFVLKTPLILQGVAPTSYSIVTAPNSDSSDLGEIFKLVPVTLNNLRHHLTHKALSQLPIVANVNIANNIRRIQITSKLLGSLGAIEVVGGNANGTALSIFDEAQVTPGLSGDFLEVQTAAYPITLTAGDMVSIENTKVARRLSRLQSSDLIDVNTTILDSTRYLYNPKVTGINTTTEVTITDVSAVYGRSSGIVWRWTFSNNPSVDLQYVNAGDVLNAYGMSGAVWQSGNMAKYPGDGQISGHPVVYKDPNNDFVDVVNPNGSPMVTTAIGASGKVEMTVSPTLKWNLAHSARTTVDKIVVSSGIATVTTKTPHWLNTSDSFSIIDNVVVPTDFTVLAVLSPIQFTFNTSSGDLSQTSGDNGSIMHAGRTTTRYAIQSLGFNGLFRLQYIGGDSPYFVDCGVAVDDMLILGGKTFKNINNGTYRVLGVDSTSIVFQSEKVIEELHTLVAFNNLSLPVTWTTNFNKVIGAVGDFVNVAVGDWIKKTDDADDKYVQVIDLLDSTLASVDSAHATQLLLGDTYKGLTASSRGVTFDQLNGVNQGVILQNVDDIVIYEGDSARVGDQLFIDKIINSDWFGSNNSDTFSIIAFGSDATTYRPYIKINNPLATNESNRHVGVSMQGYFILENEANRYASIRMVEHSIIDNANPERRTVYLTPSVRASKMTQSYGTRLIPIGKLGYPVGVTTGVDGYLYYTGLMRKVQRIIDGFEPDPINYPGRRAVGGVIETLPSLIRKVTIAVDVTTKDGVNLTEIINDVKSVIISYVKGLGVGQNVVLSEIIARVIAISGVAAVTFTNPTPNTESIAVSDNEKAYCELQDISVA